MNKLNTFTSTGWKFLRQIVEQKVSLVNPRPISLQVALTEKCNLKCSFCSVVNRERKHEWDFYNLVDATVDFFNLGTRTVEITGGGEPLLYPHFNEYVQSCKNMGLELGLITNGIFLHKLPKEILDSFEWIRISMNCLDYVDSIEIPKIKGTLGFSYVFGADSDFDSLCRVVELGKNHNVSYVRVVPNCLSSEEELQEQHKLLQYFVETIGEPAFYQKKDYGQSKRCNWCFYKPFLYCDEKVYPCSSIAINPDADKSFEPSYAICHWSEVERIMYSGNRKVVDVSKCNRCVFEAQNNLIDSLIEPIQHKNFI